MITFSNAGARFCTVAIRPSLWRLVPLLRMFGAWQWWGEGWWHRTNQQTGWVEWRRVGGYTPGEGGHRSRAPRAEGTILQMDLPYTANFFFQSAACPHDAYVAFQEELFRDLGVRMRRSSGMYLYVRMDVRT